MDELITTLYLSNVVVASVAYGPQCLTLWRMLRTDRVNKSVSLLTWLLWSWACLVTLIYALVVSPDDWAFTAISFVNALFCAVTLALTVLVHLRANEKARRQIDG